MKTEDINRYLELAFGNTFEPLPESAEGKVRLQCTRKTADAMRKGVIIRGEEIKAHAMKKRDADNNDEEEPCDDDGGGSMRRGAGKSADKDLGGPEFPSHFSEKRGDRWSFACAKIGVQICISASVWAVQSPDQLCNSF